VWSLIFTGNLFALIILLILLAMSVLSWTIIVAKWLQFRGTAAENRHFYSAYSRDQPLANLYSLAQKFGASPLARLFEVSYREIGAFRQQLEQGANAPAGMRERLMTNLSRSLERGYNQQHMRLEGWLPTLAIVSSSAPYIGLFGTVLGIIRSFQQLGAQGSSSLRAVGPGISEALIATAVGLLAAIPAAIAFNQFGHAIKEMGARMDDFTLEFLNMTERTYGE
jgi:biopolymer transport protein TolQ